MAQDTNPGRWGGHPRLARLVRALVFLAPVAASVGAAAVVRPLLPAVPGPWGRVLALVVLVAVSTLVLVAVDRIARRALPLATLLDLSMLFPDHAPSRLRVARDAIRRAPIEEQLARVAEAGADPGAVAREILTLVAALSAHDRPSRGHAERVRMYTDLLAEELRVPQRDRDLLRWAAILHDVGKLRVPTTLLNKPGKPTTAEWAVLRAHPADGAAIAGALLPWLGEWGAVIAEHHERYDGTGYPLGLGGRGISVGARIVSVADAYDVMTAARAYQRPVSRAAARRELVRFSGSQFDPVVVRAMLSVSTPRLRRAQGLLAWLADIPLVASGSVPAATVARVVGAGALATGAVAGGVGLGAATEPTPRAHAQVLQLARQEPARPTSSPGPSATAAAHQGRPAAARRHRGGAHGGGATGHRAPATPPPTGSATAEEPDHGDRSRAEGAPVGATAHPGSGSASSSESKGSKGGKRSGDPSPTPAPTPTSGVPGGTLADPVGTVTDTVDDAVTDPVGTVDDTLDAVTGTVTGVVGGSHRGPGSGGGSGGGGSSGSGSGGQRPNSGPGSGSSGPGSGGLVGGVLGH